MVYEVPLCIGMNDFPIFPDHALAACFPNPELNVFKQYFNSRSSNRAFLKKAVAVVFVVPVHPYREILVNHVGNPAEKSADYRRKPMKFK